MVLTPTFTIQPEEAETTEIFFDFHTHLVVMDVTTGGEVKLSLRLPRGVLRKLKTRLNELKV